MQIEKPVRGRPKTLDRQHVLNTAMMSYWADGAASTSVNEICKRAGVSKPGLYREFGSEDGLKRAALVNYQAVVLEQLYNAIDADKPFAETLGNLIPSLLIDRDVVGLPQGCLYVDMCNCKEQLGKLATEKLDELRLQALIHYEKWVDQAKTKGEFKADISTRRAALYISEQLGSAMMQQKRGETDDDTKAFLRLSLSVLV